MRRPDLPLILIVLATGAALAVFADGAAHGGGGEQPARGGTTPSSDPAAEFLADAGPALTRCLAGDVTPTAGGSSSPPSAPGKLVDQVSAQVERLRELRYERPVEVRFLSAERLADRLSVLLRKELPEGPVEREGEVLELLGAIRPGSDLLGLESDALGSQVIGLYDPETKELLVLRSGKPDAEELITLAHELEHALADQQLGLDTPKGLAAADRALARVSVIEGDATLTMTRYALAELGLGELGSLGESSVPGAERQFDRLPDYIQRSLLFPYLEGLRLVCYQWLTGGWKAVDRLYAHSPPSTYQVMFPVSYGDGPPADPRPPGRLDPPWRQRARRELGAAELSWLFAAPGGDPEARIAAPVEPLPTPGEQRAAEQEGPRRYASAWRGGELELWARGRESALGISLVEAGGTNLLCGGLAGWYIARFPDADRELSDAAPDAIAFRQPGRTAILTCEGREVRMGIAPDEETARRVAG